VALADLEATAHGEPEAIEGIAVTLRELRMQVGIRQIDMARALGKPQAFVSYYESGARRLDLLELRQIRRIRLAAESASLLAAFCGALAC